ncbi:MAG: NAD-dependent epimerase/dehydratase family protein [Candidatus Nitrohelix vancouverensis]|uniref:NAD-dependent epimerase/dehydratase family protein n=1 Tax=Candidatus Nitrohelix vancouverensis TaxID=2705534 RepID=A0A7T0G3I0_9BACT|nr:MAG: NAD-dependent epimerase/dehydratase family protein [Candidatus Nitrohelix vancouverensis]
MAKKVLVTGGAGFIGSHTVDALIEQEGRSVRVYDNLTPQVHGENAERPQHLHADAEFVLGDMRDRDGVQRALQDVDVVIHDAAEVGVGQSMYSIDQYISSNVGGTGVLWDVLVNETTQVEKVIVASSMSLYGEGRYRCEEHGVVVPAPRSEAQMKAGHWELQCPTCEAPALPVPTDEDKALDSSSVYAQSKRDQEVYSLLIGRAHKIPTVACRYFNCYGPRQSLNNPYTGAAAIFCSAIQNGKAPLIYEDGHQVRDMIHVRDLVQGKITLMKHAEDGIFNIGTGVPTSILKLAETLIDLFGQDFAPNVIGKFRNGDIRHCYGDISRISALGFQPKISLREGLEELADWVRGQESVSQIEQAHQALLEKGLVV